MSKYLFKEKSSTLRNTFIVTIKADSNDADYVMERMDFSLEDFHEYVIDELINLKKNYSGSHELEKYPNEHDLYIPYNGWDGYCHTLEELKVEYVDENGKFWDVEINENF